MKLKNWHFRLLCFVPVGEGGRSRLAGCGRVVASVVGRLVGVFFGLPRLRGLGGLALIGGGCAFLGLPRLRGCGPVTGHSGWWPAWLVFVPSLCWSAWGASPGGWPPSAGDCGCGAGSRGGRKLSGMRGG